MDNRRLPLEPSTSRYLLLFPGGADRNNRVRGNPWPEALLAARRWADTLQNPNQTLRLGDYAERASGARQYCRTVAVKKQSGARRL